MTKHSRFFLEDRQPAAILKHGILDRYLAKFAAKVGSTSAGNRVGYIDGFAGSGVYQNPVTKRISPGSPKIALDIAAGLPKRTLECTFIEKQRREFASLRRVVAGSDNAHALALHGDSHTELGPALGRFSDLPLLVFLDPFGTSLNAQTIVNVLRRESYRPTEVLLNFSIESVRRIGGRIYNPEGDKGRSASLARMDSWLGGDWWREYFLADDLRSNIDRVSLAADSVFQEYVRRINVEAHSSAFVVPIRKQPHHKPIFNLTLFHSNQLALMPFNESVSLALQDWRYHLQELDLTEADLQEWRDPPLPGLSRVDELKAVFADDEVAFRVGTIDAIAESIELNIRQRAKLSVRDDFQLVFGAAVGAGRELHLRAAWKELAARQVVEIPPTGKLEWATITRRGGPTP